MAPLQQAFAAVADRRRVVLVALLLATLVVGAGVTQLTTAQGIQQYRGDSPAAEALSYVEDNLTGGSENVTRAQIVVRDDNALDRETLLATLRYQQRLRTNEIVGPTLANERPTVGLANVVARAAIQHRKPGAEPDLEAQIAALRSMSDTQVRRAVTAVLGRDSPIDDRVLAFVPTHYEPGTAEANATMVIVRQQVEAPQLEGLASDRIVASQLAMQDSLANSSLASGSFVIGNGIVTSESTQARQDSMQLVGPLALLFVILTLVVAYRDLLDVLLGVAGIVLVLLWTFGALGWLGVAYSPLFVAVPVLLIGLSIDYAIHVFMRYREARDDGADDPRAAMREALPAVGVALVWVTLTTAIGFLSNVVSPVGPLRDIGVIAAVGISAALVVFGGLIPALKVELDTALERVGLDRAKRAIGTRPGRFRSALSVGVGAARRSPGTLLLVVLLVSGGAAATATGVSTSFQPEDFFPGDTPDWMEELPEAVQPGAYEAKGDLAYLHRHFVSQDATASVLLRGDPTDPAVLDRLDGAAERAAQQPTVRRLASGEAQHRSPATLIRTVAAEDEQVATAVAAADTDGDGLPEDDVAAVYDAVSAAAPDRAASVLHRQDGRYVAARLVVAVDGSATSQAVRDDLQPVAEAIEGEGVEATATGDIVVRANVQDELLTTLVETLALTLVAVAGLLAVVFRLAYGRASLGLVTIVPVVLTVAWIVASMTLLGIPLSVLTALVASLTIGIGIDYAIHLTERFVDERRDGAPPEQAVADAVAGTGSALFASAVTTSAGFGVLALAVLPMLQQFGAITALTIAYAFVATVLVLPSLLVLWSRYVGFPAVDETPASRHGAAPAVDDD